MRLNFHHIIVLVANETCIWVVLVLILVWLSNIRY